MNVGGNKKAIPQCKIISWNARSFWCANRKTNKTNPKFQEKKKVLFKNNPDICLVQEVRVLPGQENAFKENFCREYEVFVNCATPRGDSFKGGTAILVKKEFLRRNNVKAEEVMINRGFSSGVHIKGGRYDVFVCNVYIDSTAGYTGKIRHIKSFRNCVPDTDNIIFGGDFNMIMDPLDKVLRRDKRDPYVVATEIDHRIEEAFKEFFLDRFQLSEVSQDALTFAHPSGLSRERLDRFYVSFPKEVSKVCPVHIRLPTFDGIPKISDHRPIILDVGRHVKSPFPKLPSWVYNCPGFVKAVEQVFWKDSRACDPNPWVRLQCLNDSFFTVSGDFKKASKRPQPRNNEDKIALAIALARVANGMNKGEKIDGFISSFPYLAKFVQDKLIHRNNDVRIIRVVELEGLYDYIKYLQEQIDKDEEEVEDSYGCNTFGNSQGDNFAKKLARLKPTGSASFSAVHDPEKDTFFTDGPNINRITKKHWGKVWEGLPTNISTLRRVLGRFSRRMSGEGWEISDEIIEDIILKGGSTSPGPDGVPFKAYKNCFRLSFGIFKDLIGDLTGDNKYDIPDNFIQCLLYFLPKKFDYLSEEGMQVYGPGSLRPISVAPVAVRILSNILRAVFTKKAMEFIAPGQAGFLPEGSLYQNVCDVFDFYYDGWCNNKNNCVALVDFSAAFSSLSQIFIKDYLTEIGVPAAWVDGLSKFFRCEHKLVFKGNRYDNAPLLSGTRQGDPLSPVIFITCLEILRDFLKTRDIDDRAYADGIALRIRNFNSRKIGHIIRIFDEFKEVSGLSVNVKKTYFLPTFSLRPNVIPWLRANSWGIYNNIRWEETYLGVLFGKDVTPLSVSNKACVKFKDNVRKWWNVAISHNKRIDVINIFIHPLLSHIFQFYLVPEDILRSLNNLSRIFITRIHMCSVDMLCRFKSILGFEGPRDLIIWNIATILRASQNNRDIVNISIGSPSEAVILARARFEEITGVEFFRYYDDLRNHKSLQSKIYNFIKEKDGRDSTAKDQLIHKIGRFIGDGAREGWFEKFRRIVKKAGGDRYGLYCFWRIIVNGVHTKRRSRFWRDFQSEVCVFCGQHRDHVEHWFGSENNPCLVLSVFATKISRISWGSNILKCDWDLDKIADTLRIIKAVCSAHFEYLKDDKVFPADFSHKMNILRGWWKFYNIRHSRCREIRDIDVDTVSLNYRLIKYFHRSLGYQFGYCIGNSIYSPLGKLIEQPKRLISSVFDIYTDGSESRDEGGWGFTVLGLKDGFVDFCGRVSQDVLLAFDLPKMTNSVCEVFAMSRVFLFLCQIGVGSEVRGKVRIWPDSKHTKDHIQYQIGRNSNRRLIHDMMDKYHACLKYFDIDVFHVYSHSGHFFNGRADLLADQGREGVEKWEYYLEIP